MIMFETIFATLAAIITVIIAGLLVQKQNKCERMRKELEDQLLNSLEFITNEMTILTNEKPEEHTLLYLEQKMESFNKKLNIVKQPTYKRRNKSVKRKKNITND